MEHMIQDVRFGVRMLLKSPMVTGAAILSLALGIGANKTKITVVNAVFLTSMPVEQPDRLARVYTLEWEFPGTSDPGRRAQPRDLDTPVRQRSVGDRRHHQSGRLRIRRGRRGPAGLSRRRPDRQCAPCPAGDSG